MKAKELDRLLCSVQRGDNGAFEEFYVKTSRGVYAFYIRT